VRKWGEKSRILEPPRNQSIALRASRSNHFPSPSTPVPQRPPCNQRNTSVPSYDAEEQWTHEVWIQNPGRQSQRGNPQSARDRHIEPLVQAMVNANSVRHANCAAKYAYKGAQLGHFWTDRSRETPGAPGIQSWHRSLKNVNRDGICDGVTEDKVCGQREEAQTFMSLDTSQYGVESAYQVHRQQSIALSPAGERNTGSCLYVFR
jgi:hypothetical protein